MTTTDLAVLAPFIAAILVAAAILVIDFVFPRPARSALAVAFAGLALVGLLTALVGQEPLPKTRLRRRLRRRRPDDVPGHPVHHRSSR